MAAKHELFSKKIMVIAHAADHRLDVVPTTRREPYSIQEYYHSFIYHNTLNL
jgi:hypothetical protein